MTNPLLSDSTLPLFSQIQPEHIEPAITQLLDEARAVVEQHLLATTDYTWKNLIEPLENAEDRLNKAWSPVSHINSVVNTDELREAYNACLPKLSEYSTEMGQNEQLFNAYQIIANSDDFATLDNAQQKIIHNGLRDFKLSGVDLNSEKKQRYKEISQELSRLASNYEEKILDATNAWSKRIRHEQDLAGLPDSALAGAKQKAGSGEEEGWVVTLEVPSYQAGVTYSDGKELCRENYEALSKNGEESGRGKG